jgi:AraC-like DNA-binding protein
MAAARSLLLSRRPCSISGARGSFRRPARPATGPPGSARSLRDRGLLDEVRHSIARTALAEPGISVNEVAYLLGFSDASAFTKAFKRWTGTSSGEKLRELRER